MFRSNPAGIIFLFFFLFSLSPVKGQNPIEGSVAQQNVTDSLETLLNKTSGVDKTDVLEKLSYEYRYTDHERASAFARAGLSLSRSLKYKEGEARILSVMGIIKKARGEYDSAIAFYQQAIELEKKLNNVKRVISNLNDLGIVYEEKGELPVALQHYLEALKKGEEISDLIGVATAQINVGFIYLAEQDYERAYAYFQQGLNTSKQADYTKGEVWSYSNLGIALTKMKKFEEARAMYLKARSYLDDGKHDREMGRLFNNIALTYEDEKNYSKALEYLLKAASLKEKFNEPYDMASTYANIADTYQKDGQFDKAIQYAQKSYKLAQKAGTPDVIQPALRSLANSYSSLKDFEKAYQYKKEEFELQDSIYSLERLRIQREMMAKYETEKKDRENDLLKKEKQLNEASVEKQYYIILSICLALILITFMVVVLWRMYIRKSRINKWLNEHNLEMEAKNKSLEKSIDEKNSLMNVVAHDLKSPLNKVKGLTELIKLEGGLTLSQKEYLGLIEVVTEQGKRLISDLLTLNEIEANGQDAKKQEIDLQHFIHECAHEFKQQAHKKSITLHVKNASPNPEPVYSNKDSLQRIIDNLVSNAIKFSPQGKNIYVETEKNGKTFTIRVRDEGPGISEEDRKKLFKRFQRLSAQPTGGEPSSGLGLAIVKQLVTQLEGTIEVQSKPKEGAVFEVTFPV